MLVVLGLLVAAAGVLLGDLLGVWEAGWASSGVALWGMEDESTQVVLSGVIALLTPFWLLDLALVGFHCFLCATGLTTYEYLTGGAITYIYIYIYIFIQ